MKYINMWLSRPIYEIIPVAYMLAAIALIQITDNTCINLFAFFLFLYSLYIGAWRLMARDSILIN